LANLCTNLFDVISVLLKKIKKFVSFMDMSTFTNTLHACYEIQVGFCNI
jgi:hypothetical protein